MQFPEVEGREAFLPQLYAVGDVFLCGFLANWVVLKGLAEGLDLVISLKPRPGRRKSRKEAFPASDAPTTLPSPNVGVSASSGSSGSVRNVATTERNDVMTSKIDANSSSSDCVWGGDGERVPT